MRLIDADKFKNQVTLQPSAGTIDTLQAEAICKIIDAQPTVEQNQWIPVTEKLPKCEEEVYIQTKKGTITTAMYEDGTMPDEESAWNWTDIDFDYDENSDTFYVPRGWWEYRHFNPDDVYNNKLDEEVLAWMPKPESYHE